VRDPDHYRLELIERLAANSRLTAAADLRTFHFRENRVISISLQAIAFLTSKGPVSRAFRDADHSSVNSDYSPAGLKYRLSSHLATSLPSLSPCSTELRKWKPSQTRASTTCFWMTW
jgi:hypothetical protein